MLPSLMITSSVQVLLPALSFLTDLAMGILSSQLLGFDSLPLVEEVFVVIVDILQVDWHLSYLC